MIPKSSKRKARFAFWYNLKEFQLPKYIKNNHDPNFMNFASFLEFDFPRSV